MKAIKFSILTLFLIAIVAGMTPYALAFGFMSSLFSTFKCREFHLFFHKLTQDVLSLMMDSFDYADTVMRHRHMKEFGESNYQNYSVAYFDKQFNHLGSAVVQSHCEKCAEIDGYHSRFAGYDCAAVERTM